MTFDQLSHQCWKYFSYDTLLVIVAIGVWLLWRAFVPSRLGTPRPAGLRLPAPLKFGWGVVLALGALALALAPGLICDGFTLGPGYARFAYAEGSSYGEAGLVWGFFAVQSAFEELAFRGVALGLLGLLIFWLANALGPALTGQSSELPGRMRYQHWAWFYSGLAANCVVALAFGWVHRHNPHVGQFALVNIVLAGLVLGQLYWQQGQPLGAWAFHWVWNAGQASLGLPVSGITIGPMLVGELGFTGARAGTLTGGAFGLEASWPCSLALGLIFACLAVAQWQELARFARQQ